MGPPSAPSNSATSKPNPNVAAARPGEVFAPDLLEFLREVGIDAVGIECKRIRPLDLSGFRIDEEPSFLADGEPLFARCLIIHENRVAHLLILRHSLLLVGLFACTFVLSSSG